MWLSIFCWFICSCPGSEVYHNFARDFQILDTSKCSKAQVCFCRHIEVCFHRQVQMCFCGQVQVCFNRKVRVCSRRQYRFVSVDKYMWRQGLVCLCRQEKVCSHRQCGVSGDRDWCVSIDRLRHVTVNKHKQVSLVKCFCRIVKVCSCWIRKQSTSLWLFSVDKYRYDIQLQVAYACIAGGLRWGRHGAGGRPRGFYKDARRLVWNCRSKAYLQSGALHRHHSHRAVHRPRWTHGQNSGGLCTSTRGRSLIIQQSI